MEANMREPQRAIVIQSPHSGRSELLSQALTLLEQAGVKVARVLSIASLNTLPPQGAVWREQGMMLAIAAGGDGVVGGVIAHLAAGGLPLGILPLGTANDIARSLRIPHNLPQAVEVIAQGHTQPIDIGVAWPVAKAPQQEPTLAPTMPQKQACFAHALTVGLNVQFAVRSASFSDRLLDIVVIEERGRGYLNKRLAHFFHPEGRVSAQPARTHASYPTRHPAELTGIPGIHHLQARGVTITTGADPQDATLDGEVRVQTPLRVQVADEPLHVVVPSESRGGNSNTRRTESTSSPCV
jgi:diacylglycerol kinase family enzyme